MTPQGAGQMPKRVGQKQREGGGAEEEEGGEADNMR